MKTYTATVKTETKAQAVTCLLVKESRWFSCEPWPDDEWQITVKAEDRHILQIVGV